MARAIWKGNISFGLVNIPVHLFNAEKSSSQIHLHLLDKKTHSRIHNKRVNEQGQEVAWDDIVHAYEFNKGKYVIVDQKMLEKTAAENYETVAIDSFVPMEQLNPIYLEKPYYLIPTTQGQKGYSLLRDVLYKTKKVGIATVVIKTREHLAAILPYDDYLLLMLLRYAKEIAPIKDMLSEKIKANPKNTYNKKELALADQLVESMSSDFTPQKYTDANKELLRKLINTNIKSGKTISSKDKKITHNKKIIDFAELLEQSVKKKRKAT